MVGAINKSSVRHLPRLHHQVAPHREVTVIEGTNREIGSTRVNNRACSPNRDSSPLSICWEKLPVTNHIASYSIGDVVSG